MDVADPVPLSDDERGVCRGFLASSDEIVFDPNGWTIRSADGSRGDVKHTFAITEGDPIVMTARG